MINQKQQKEMLDYLVARLEKNYSNVTPMTRKISHGIDTNYIKVDDGLLLLIDKGFSVKENGKNLNTLGIVHNAALNFSRQNYGNSNVGFIIYKDGENFFRPAADRHSYKSEHGLSLKNYDDEDFSRMILFRPEEKYIFDKKEELQYFQPEAEGLKKGIYTFDFKPVIFDYSHIDAYHKFKPKNKPSERDHIFSNDRFMDEDIMLSGGFIIPYKK